VGVGSSKPVHPSAVRTNVRTQMELTSSQKGGLAELKIAAAAADLGIGVLRSMTDGLRYDLVFDVFGELVRVQCKWATLKGDVVSIPLRTSRHTPAGYVRTVYDADEIEGFAAYCRELDSCFYLPISDFAGRQLARLRLGPARNGQRLGVKMAADYLLGAVAQLGERRAGSAKVRGSSPLSSTPAPDRTLRR
jgi:hypothetical protein